MNFLLETTLKDEYFVLPVSNVFDAANRISNKNDFDLILIDTDYQSQESNDFIHHVKSSRLFGQIPVIALQSKANNSLEISAHEVVDQVVYKPFNPADLKKAIEILITSDEIKTL